jgi:hypothetical protein
MERTTSFPGGARAMHPGATEKPREHPPTSEMRTVVGA